MKLIKILLIPVLAFWASHTYGQSEGSIYRTDGAYLSGIKLTVDGVEKKLAWCGGVNTPQFATPDLNKDGINDLVIFEAYWLLEEKGIKTFINNGTAGNPDYRYVPDFEYLFPYVSQFLNMQDYNCDGVADLFHFGLTGIGVCDGFYNNDNMLAFRNCRNLTYLYPGATVPSNIGVGGNDVPAIVDVDNDGDLDILTFSQLGAVIYWYKNQKTEKGYPCDTFAVQLRDFCWGRMYQFGPREHMLHNWCDNSMLNNQPKATDGSNTLCLFDADGDGDYDILNGNSMFSDVQFMRNNRIQFGNAVDSMTWQDTTWQSGGKKAYAPTYPLAMWVDMDADGDKDIVVSPIGENAENYKSVLYYKNTGSNGSPNFAYQSDTFLVENMLDLGSHSYPVFYDYNKDGKKDLFVGSRGRYQPDGTFKTTIWHFENTTSGSNISFKLIEKDFLRIDTIDMPGAALAMGDLDNDGLDELVVGRLDGKLTYYKNIAPSANDQPVWQLWQRELRDVNATEIDAGNFATPVIYDMDNDGKKDLVIGNETGYLTFYKNTGTVGQLSLQFQTNKLGNVKAEPDHTYGYSAPFIGKMDNINKEYLVVGTGYGRLFRYDGFQNGNVTTSYSVADTQYSDIRLPGKFIAPAIADLDGDGKYEMFIGNDKGGLFAYRQVWNVNVDEVSRTNDKLEVYPNPAQNRLTIRSMEEVPAGAELKIYNSMGQLVKTETLHSAVYAISTELSALQPGLYLCTLSFDGKTKVARFTKLTNQ